MIKICMFFLIKTHFIIINKKFFSFVIFDKDFKQVYLTKDNEENFVLFKNETLQ